VADRTRRAATSPRPTTSRSVADRVVRAVRGSEYVRRVGVDHRHRSRPARCHVGTVRGVVAPQGGPAQRRTGRHPQPAHPRCAGGGAGRRRRGS
jgi:hypothetical protein